MKQTYLKKITELLDRFYFADERTTGMALPIILEGKEVYSILRQGMSYLVLPDKSAEEPVGLNTLSEEAQYDIFRYLDAHKQLLVEYRSVMVEMPGWEGLKWKEQPAEITGADGMVIARIGVIDYSETEWALLLVSSDNSWTTLAVWVKGDEVARATATTDLHAIHATLSNIILPR